MRKWVVGLLVVAAAVAAGTATRAQATPQLTKVTLQLTWVPQAQFAGYYAALDLGYYKAAGLNVKLLNGGPQIVQGQVVAAGRAQFGVNWLTALLAARDTGTQLVDIAQVFSRSGMTELTWKSSGISSIAKMKDKKVANWLGGDQYELFAALTKNGMNPAANKGVTIVQQPFDMGLFLNHQVDAASAMTYNELAQVLETKNPKTGKLYQLSNLNVIKMDKIGTGMLEDGIFGTESWLKDKKNQATAKKFLAASFKGWIYCRTHLKDCVKIVLSHGPTLLKGHQTWQMNEINALIWPAPLGIGLMNAKDYQFTAKTTAKYNHLKQIPGHEAYRTDLAKAAQAALKKQGIDIYGKGWKKANVKVTPGG